MTLKTLLAVLMGLAIAPSALAKPPSGIVIQGAWIREAPPGATALAAYATVTNRSDHADRLLGVAASAFKKASFHQMTMEHGVMHMAALPQLVLPAHQSVVFKPGANHIMLEDPKRPLRAGNKVRLVFTFEHAGTVHLEVPVERRPE